MCKIKPSAKILTTISTVKMAMNTGSNSSCKKRKKKELEPVYCKKWPVKGLGRWGRLKDLKDFKLILNESKLFP